MASTQEEEALLGDTSGPKLKRSRSLKEVTKEWTWCHLCVFFLTFNSYALLHACRKAFSNVKSRLESEWTPLGDCNGGNNSLFCYIEPKEVWKSEDFFETGNHAELFLGELDTIFLFMYAVGLYISGAIGDRFPLRQVLSFGMCASSVAVFLFGSVTRWARLYSISFYAVIWAVNGLLQSTAWPSVVAIMGNWFGKDGRGFVFGVWSACASVGNIIGAILVSAVLDFGFEYTFLVPSVCLFAGGIINIFCLAVDPSEVGLIPTKEDSEAPTAEYEVQKSTNLNHCDSDSGTVDYQTETGQNGTLGSSVATQSAPPEQELIEITGTTFVSGETGDSSSQQVNSRQSTDFGRVSALNVPGSPDLSHEVPSSSRSYVPVASSSDDSESEEYEDKLASSVKGKKKAINFFAAWKLPGVLVYSLSYACLKLVNYALFFWLPYYLSKGLQWDEHKADELSTLYDVGGIFGGIVGGLISDWLGVRSPVVVAMLVIAAPSLFLYKRFGVTYSLNAFLMTVAGFFIGGPANIESSAISADLGKQPALRGNAEAISTVTGIVDGSGSIGAAAGQYLVSLIDTKTNWKNVFYFLMAMLLSSALWISELCYRDVRQLWHSWRQKRNGWVET